MNGSIFKYLLCTILLTSISFSQSKLDLFLTPSDTLHISRRNTVVVSQASAVSLTLIGLNELWYTNFKRSKFQIINDNEDWLQMDKFGHMFSAYQIGRFGSDLLNWSGVGKKNTLVYGATLGFGFLTAVEVLDGYSKEWGFSWGDILANASGTGFYIAQELLWSEQRIAIKFSFSKTKYANLSPENLGKTGLEQVLKDYNGQTYWFSFNVHDFLNKSKIPKWLNIAIGYGAKGMLSGQIDYNNQLLMTNSRYRQYYLSLDVNLSKLKTKSVLLKSVFKIFNMLKIPSPTLEFSKKGGAFHLFFN